MTETAQDILDDLVTSSEEMVQHMLKRPGMWAAHLETFHRTIQHNLNLIERIERGKETNFVHKASKVVENEYFNNNRSPLAPWGRFLYLYEVDQGDYPENKIPVGVYHDYFTMPQNREHPHHEDIMNFYRKWVKLALAMIRGDGE